MYLEYHRACTITDIILLGCQVNLVFMINNFYTPGAIKVPALFFVQRIRGGC